MNIEVFPTKPQNWQIKNLRFQCLVWFKVLNVSVAAAIVLYEALRQRMKKGLYEKSVLSKIDLEELIEKWSRK